MRDVAEDSSEGIREPWGSRPRLSTEVTALCHEEGAAAALLTWTSNGPVNWLMGIPELQCNGCECSDYLTERRVDLGEMALLGCQK